MSVLEALMILHVISLLTASSIERVGDALIESWYRTRLDTLLIHLSPSCCNASIQLCNNDINKAS